MRSSESMATSKKSTKSKAKKEASIPPPPPVEKTVVTVADTAEKFDRNLYTRIPILDLPDAIALGTALLAALPQQMPETVTDAASTLSTELNAAKAEQTPATNTSQTPTDVRSTDAEMDNAWAAMIGRLQSYARLPSERYERALRSRELLLTLAPDGLSVLQLAFRKKWAVLDARLRTITTQGSREEVQKLAGDDFLLEVDRAFERYGKVLGITEPAAPEKPRADLLERLRSLREAISEFLFQVAASANNRKPETVAKAKAALRPVDEFRASAARRDAQNKKNTKKEAPANSTEEDTQN